MQNITQKIVILLFFTLLIPRVLATESIEDLVDVVRVESCYVKLDIVEELINNETIKFSLGSLENVYGIYDTFVETYSTNGGNYILETYDQFDNLLNEFSLYSSLITFYDSGETSDPGGIVVSDSSTIITYIPYNSDISSIKINNSGQVTDFVINPSDIKCQRTCSNANEVLDDSHKQCCLGLTKIFLNDGSFICTNCGDSICSEYENWYSCSLDCEQENETVIEECTDDCFNSLCVGYDFYECVEGEDGCMDRVNKEREKGICNVECVNDADCGANKYCELYKCAEVIPETNENFLDKIDMWINDRTSFDNLLNSYKLWLLN